MIGKYPQLMCILLLMVAAALAGQAQDQNDADNTIANSVLLNDTGNTSLNTSLNASTNMTADLIPANHTAMNNTSQNATAMNLSTLSDHAPEAVFIDEIAKTAPVVAAFASSAQASSRQEGAFLLGPSIGGLDPFHPSHILIESTKIGMPIKPMRDTGKMVFVCDIV